MHRLSHQVSWNITTRGSEPKLAQGGGAQHVNPARSACNPETCLIQMFHYGLFARQQVFHRFGKNVHVLGRFGDQLGQRCRCDLDALNIHNHLRQALLGDAVQNLQIGSQSRNSIAILSGGDVTPSGMEVRACAPQLWHRQVCARCSATRGGGGRRRSNTCLAADRIDSSGESAV